MRSMDSSPNIQRVEQELKKRMQELECLYNIGPEITSKGEIEHVLTNLTVHLIRGVEFPEIAASSIWFDGKEYSAAPLPKEQVVESLTSDIVVDSQTRGTVAIYYRRKAKFLEEEQKMLDNISQRISRSIKQRELQAEVQRYVDGLEGLVKKKIEELESAKERYENLFESVPVPITLSRLNGDIVKANRAFYRLLGYEDSTQVKLNFVKNHLFENLDEMRAIIHQKLAQEGQVVGFELTIRDNNWESIPVIGSCVFIDYDGERCVEAVYKDIRVRKELEKKLRDQNENLERKVKERTLDLENQKDLLMAKNQELLALAGKLRESRTRFKALFKAITDTVVVIDRNLNILMSNQKAIGYEGKCYHKVFGGEAQCEDCLALQVVKAKAPVTQEKAFGDEHYLLQAYPMFDSDGEVDGILEISRVITKEKNMGRQLLQADKLASLGQLVSGIAHEINNPNTFIRGNLYIIQEAMNDLFPILDQFSQSHPDFKIARLNYDIFRKNVPVLIDDMVGGANRIKGIVDGLRKFAKRDEGLLNESVNLNLVAESCLRLVDNQIRRTADVKVDLRTDIPPVVGNLQKLQQVVVNILINASQAIVGPRGTISLMTACNDKEVMLKVNDDGKGMDERTIKQIFDPFFTTKRTQGGTGLGLSIAYGIIKEHQGRIEVESKTGAGTTFCIYIPKAPEEGS
ncbi:MAG TPA: ATP-binding protein [Syntrophorhabdaceae bacterium]|jgi:PAS domain S-box-containing protein